MGIPRSVRQDLWDVHFPSQRYGTCFVCTKSIDITNFEAGHVKACSQGGTQTIDNLRPICLPCNRSMGVQNLDEFKETYYRMVESLQLPNPAPKNAGAPPRGGPFGSDEPKGRESTKAKKPRTEAQKAQFEKAKARRLENIVKRKEEQKKQAVRKIAEEEGYVLPPRPPPTARPEPEAKQALIKGMVEAEGYQAPHQIAHLHEQINELKAQIDRQQKQIDKQQTQLIAISKTIPKAIEPQQCTAPKKVYPIFEKRVSN